MKIPWDLLLLAIVVVSLFAARWLPLRRGNRSPAELQRAAWNEFVVWIAEGFGVGRIAFGPGTFGSLIGLVWMALLIRLGDLIGFFIGVLVGLVASVAICGAAERITGKKDP